MKQFKKLNSPDRITNMIQDNLSTALRPLINSCLADARVLSNVALVAGTNTVNHGMGRNLNGWQVIRYKTAAPSIYARYSGVGLVPTIGTSLTILDFDTKAFDTASAVTTGTAWKFTCPVAGVYMVSAAVGIAIATYDLDDRVYTSVHKNGSNYAMLEYWHSQNAAYSSACYLCGATAISCSAGDYLDVRAAANPPAGTVTRTTSAYHQHITISLTEPNELYDTQETNSLADKTLKLVSPGPTTVDLLVF